MSDQCVQRLRPPRPGNMIQNLAADRLVAAMLDFNRALSEAEQANVHLIARHATSGRITEWSLREGPGMGVAESPLAEINAGAAIWPCATVTPTKGAP